MTEINPRIEAFKAEHRSLATALTECRALLAAPEQLVAKLRTVESLVINHLDAKERFYVDLVELCAAKHDAGSKSIAEIFGQNMRVQSEALRTFFSGLPRVDLKTLPRSFETMSHVMTTRVSTEERVVFPLFLKHADKQP